MKYLNLIRMKYYISKWGVKNVFNLGQRENCGSLYPDLQRPSCVRNRKRLSIWFFLNGEVLHQTKDYPVMEWDSEIGYKRYFYHHFFFVIRNSQKIFTVCSTWQVNMPVTETVVPGQWDAYLAQKKSLLDVVQSSPELK